MSDFLSEIGLKLRENRNDLRSISVFVQSTFLKGRKNEVN